MYVWSGKKWSAAHMAYRVLHKHNGFGGLGSLVGLQNVAKLLQSTFADCGHWRIAAKKCKIGTQ